MTSDPALSALALLGGSVWHTTSPNRYVSISRDGFIRVEPDLADKERWATGAGPDGYPYVRRKGGVSLFDFRDFGPAEYSNAYPLSSWRTFVPCRREWEQAIWIEIDAAAAGSCFLPGSEMLRQWKAEGAERHRLMPHIEASHLGDIPMSLARRIITLTTDGKQDLAGISEGGRGDKAGFTHLSAGN